VANIEFKMKASCFACVVISFYDITLTFSREVECIWKRKFSVGSLLFFVSRYCSLGRTIMELLVSIYVPTSVISCKIMFPFLLTLEILGALSVAIFTSCRIWAICGRRWLPFIVVLLFTVLMPFIDLLYAYTIPKRTVLYPKATTPISGGCVLMPTGDPSLANKQLFIALILSYSTAIASDALVFVITWTKTAGIWRARGESRGNFKLVTLLLRDGTLYFCALLSLYLITLIGVVVDANVQFLFMYICGALSNVLVARFILDLRGVLYGTPDDDGAISSVKFVENLGVPPEIDRSTWMTGAGEELTEDHIRPHGAEGLFDNQGKLRVHGETVPLGDTIAEDPQ